MVLVLSLALAGPVLAGDNPWRGSREFGGSKWGTSAVEAGSTGSTWSSPARVPPNRPLNRTAPETGVTGRGDGPYDEWRRAVLPSRDEYPPLNETKTVSAPPTRGGAPVYPEERPPVESPAWGGTVYPPEIVVASPRYRVPSADTLLTAPRGGADGSGARRDADRGYASRDRERGYAHGWEHGYDRPSRTGYVQPPPPPYVADLPRRGGRWGVSVGVGVHSRPGFWPGYWR